jgi:excisionase family DNA binding protein
MRQVFSMAKNIKQDRWIYPQEVCDYLGVKHHMVIRWIDQCGMPASKVGKLWCFKTADIDECVIKGGDPDEREVTE